MRWPWVSRKRLELAQHCLASVSQSATFYKNLAERTKGKVAMLETVVAEMQAEREQDALGRTGVGREKRSKP